jgi:protocatechuate 3,4-dioxygenase alpha subunit
MTWIPSASQTVGPFFNYALTADASLGIMALPGAEGERIQLKFRIVDGDGEPTPADSLIELWQADSRGRYCHPADPHAADADPNFRGFGRLETGENGACTFETVKPGAIAAHSGSMQAPHINVSVFARGLLKQLHTRVYFAGEPLIDSDPILALVPEHRRATLLARALPDSGNAWLFEIRLQGASETVFFEV